MLKLHQELQALVEQAIAKAKEIEAAGAAAQSTINDLRDIKTNVDLRVANYLEAEPKKK